MSATSTSTRSSQLLPSGLSFGWEVRTPRNLAQAVFIQTFSSAGLSHVREVDLTIASKTPPSLTAVTESPLYAIRNEWGESAVFMLDDCVAFVSASVGGGSAAVAADSPERADAIASALAEQLNTATGLDDEIPIVFWTAGTHEQPRSVRRQIKAPLWTEVVANYERTTAAALDKLMAARVPSAGRLILWHGEPGTGKTTALRALGRLWGEWCSTHFVTDPEQFLGKGTSYLLEVLTSQPGRVDRHDPHWRMVVLEDAGELLAIDAHERTGQALSRLLNITDGILGQGMDVIVLVTTNEPVGLLHPAITRPGRCWAAIEFQPLGVEAANAWLASHDCAQRVTEPTALADLYEVLRGRTPIIKRPFGFGAHASG